MLEKLKPTPAGWAAGRIIMQTWYRESFLHGIYARLWIVYMKSHLRLKMGQKVFKTQIFKGEVDKLDDRAKNSHERSSLKKITFENSVRRKDILHCQR